MTPNSAMKERYCHHCYLAHNKEKCPSCGGRNELATPDDLIFYLDADYLLSPRVEDFLKAEKIPHLKKGELGVGLAMKIGHQFEHDLYFIPLEAFRKYETLLMDFKESLEP